MTIKQIVVADNECLEGQTESVLRTEYTEVFEFDEALSNIVRDLKDTLRSDTLSVGLAAPQIGHRLAVAIVNLSKEKVEGEDLILINPKIVKETGSWDVKYESCMSIPHKKGQVRRRKKVKIEYQDIQGKGHELEASGFMARVLMHEIDHLNGVLYVDRMENGMSIEDTDLFREHGIT